MRFEALFGHTLDAPSIPPPLISRASPPPPLSSHAGRPKKHDLRHITLTVTTTPIQPTKSTHPTHPSVHPHEPWTAPRSRPANINTHSTHHYFGTLTTPQRPTATAPIITLTTTTTTTTTNIVATVSLSSYTEHRHKPKHRSNRPQQTNNTTPPSSPLHPPCRRRSRTQEQQPRRVPRDPHSTTSRPFTRTHNEQNRQRPPHRPPCLRPLPPFSVTRDAAPDTTKRNRAPPLRATSRRT